MNMKLAEYREQRTHGTLTFPFAFYHVTEEHPRHNMVYHWHPEFEIILVQSGELHLILDGEAHTAKAGDIVIIMDGVLHGGMPVNCIYECFVFDLNAIVGENHSLSPELLSIMNHKTIIRPFLAADTYVQMYTLIRNIFDTMHVQDNGYQFTVIGFIYCFLGEVIKNKCFVSTPGFSPQTNRKLAQLKAALKYIKSYYQEELSLDDLAGASNMNSRYFCRFFKEMTQKTPIDYLNYYRVECACEQIADGQKNITEIAFDNGYRDVSYFIKVFKKYKHITPLQYYKECQKI